MTPADHLLLEAKQAILDEQHRRFKALQAEDRCAEALQQFHVTLGCASDLLNHSLSLLEAIIKDRPRRDQDSV